MSDRTRQPDASVARGCTLYHNDALPLTLLLRVFAVLSLYKVNTQYCKDQMSTSVKNFDFLNFYLQIFSLILILIFQD